MIKRIHSTLFYSSNLEETKKFYEQAGFEAKSSGDGLRIRIGDYALVFIDENTTPIKNETGKKPKGLGVYTYVEVEDVDEYFKFVSQNGVQPKFGPRDWPWGKREFAAKDPDGYKVVFYSPIKK